MAPASMADVHYTSWKKLRTQPIQLSVGTQHSIVVESGRPVFLEFEESLFHHNSSALLPSILSASEECEDQHRLALNLVARCLQYLEQHPEKKWLVVGHTDTTGSDQYNDVLAKQRADCVLAAMAGDRELFMDAASCPHLSSKEKRLEVQKPDHLIILEWAFREFGWPCRLRDNFGDYFEAVREFQRCYNREGRMGNATAPELKVDADWGSLTWGAVFDCYEFELARQLLVPRDALLAYRSQIGLLDKALIADTPAIGCGEHCPIEAAGKDNYRSQTNKRVEVMLFDEEIAPVIESSAGICDAAQSLWYRELPQDKRTPLPKLHWDFPFHAPCIRDSRKLVVESPKLTEGEEVLVTVTQLVNGKELEVLSNQPVASHGGKAELDFQELSDGVVKEVPETIGDSEPGWSYRAKVLVRGTLYFSRPLPFWRELHSERY